MTAVVVLTAGLWWQATIGHSQTAANAPSAQHKIVTPAEMQWGEAPPVFRKGAKMTVLYGDPAKEGSHYIVMLHTPANYRIMPHWHPKDENVTVVSGTFAVGMGDTFDPNVKQLPQGSFFSMPAGMHHFAYSPMEAVVQVSGIGPFKLIYINPADDPSKQRATR